MLKVLYSALCFLGVILTLTELKVYGTLSGRSVGVMIMVLVLWFIDVMIPPKKAKKEPAPRIKVSNISFEVKGKGWKRI